METFEPLINLLVLMSALSVAAERLANALKLRHPELRERRAGARGEKARERRIAQRALGASVVLAVVVKADFFAILAHLEAPWDTLGWVRPPEQGWTAGRLLHTLAGTIVTGISLGFGSKFWHDLLDLLYGLRGAIGGASGARSASGGGGGGGG